MSLNDRDKKALAIFAPQMPIKVERCNLPAMKLTRDKNATNARETNRTRDAPRVEGLCSLSQRALRSLRKRLGSNLPEKG
jgi:hypothetical protein